MYTSANPVVGRLHCPQCKGEQINPIVESSVDGAMTSHSSNGRYSNTTFSNTHRNYWMCSSCGNKFRNIQNLEEEIAKTKKGVTVYKIGTIICFIITLGLIIGMLDNPITAIVSGGFTFVMVIATIVFFCFIFTTKNKVKNMTAELEYLKIHCFQ